MGGVSEADRTLGRLLVEQGLIPQARLDECLEELRRLSEAGTPSRLGEVLVRKGLLSPAHFEATLRIETPALRPPGPSSSEALPDEVAQAPPDAQFGKYVRTTRLGSGGMGEVWRAWDTELARWVALKFLKGGNDDEIARFKREAQLAGKLTHPHIAAIYDVGETRERHWIAMQFVDGKTLRDRGGVDRRALAGWLRDAARAVQYAHERGTVHRDLKPDNLMLAGEHVYVMDFGLARSTEGASNLSVSGFVVGTPAYMSPEQARGEKVDGRADVYALGVTLYEMVSGRRPFDSENPLDLLRKAQDEEAAPLEGELGTIAALAMEKDPARRYGSAGEFADDLDRWLQGEPIHARRASVVYRVRKRIAKRKAILAVAVAGLIVSLGLWLNLAPRLRRAELHREALDRVNAYMAALAERPERRAQAGAEAVLALEAALSVDDRQPMSWVWLGRCRRVLGQDPAACWDRALSLEPGHAEARLERGRQRLEEYRRRRGEPEADHASYRQRVFYRELRPESADEAALRVGGEEDLRRAREGGISGHLGAQLDSLSAFGAGDYPRAEQGSSAYLLRAPWDTEMFLLRARARRFQRKGKPAEDDCRRVLELEPGNPTALHVLCSVLRDEHRVEDAERVASEAVAAHPRDPALRTMHGRTLVDLGRWDQAQAAYERVIALDARYPGAHAGRGWVQHSVGRYDAAERDYTRALELDPKDGLAWNRRGLLRLQQRRYSEAVADYDQGVQFDRIDATGPSNRGTARLMLNDLPGAEADFSEALRMDPEFVDAWANRGVARAWLGKAEESESDFARALELEPNRPRTLEQRSKARSRRGDFEGAAADALAASRPGAPAVSLAYALAYAGRRAEALASFREAAGAHEYAHLWIWLLRAAGGESEAASTELRTLRSARGKDDWFARVADFLGGLLAEEPFLRAAESGDPKTDREQKCEAFFYAGMKRLLLGDRGAAKALFEKSVATGLADFVEHAGARAELQRLK